MRESNNEQWRAVKGFEGYAVSSLGRVKSVERIVTSHNQHGTYQKTLKERILKPAKDKDGYLYVVLYKNGIRKPYLVHRLVALAFIPNPDPDRYTIVNHKIEGAEGKLTNTVENLEWCDIPYNNAYGTHNERSAKTRTNHPDLSKTVYQFTKDTHELVKEWQSTMEVERQMGFACSNISMCCNGKKKTAYGFIWTYTHL